MITELIDRPHLSPLRYPAQAIITNFIALSGVGCSGKTAAGNALVEAGFPRMPETMRLWMDGVKAIGIDIKSLKNSDLTAFRRDLFEVAQSIVEQQALLDPTQSMIFNRPGIDALVFMKVDGIDYSRELARMKAGPQFKAICLFEPLPFVEDGTRVNDPFLQERQIKAFKEIITQLGYSKEQVIAVESHNESGDSISREDRNRFILSELASRGCVTVVDPIFWTGSEVQIRLLERKMEVRDEEARERLE